MSILSKYFFDPIRAQFARWAGSSNSGLAAAGKQALQTYDTVSSDVAGTLQAGLTANSAQALGSKLILDFEDGLRAAADAYLTAALPPIVGTGAAEIANALLSFGEQHALTYVSSLFAHARSVAQGTATAAPSPGLVRAGSPTPAPAAPAPAPRPLEPGDVQPPADV